MRWLGALRRGDWVDARVRPYAWLMLGVLTLALVFLYCTAEGRLDASGRPLGTDFSAFYAAGSLACDGLAAQAYDWAAQQQREAELFGEKAGFYPWLNPPVLLPLMELLARLPYRAALVLWLGSTGAFYVVVMRRIVPHRSTLLAAVSFGAVYANVTHGQSGFLAAALMGLGLWLLPRRPLLAGLVLALLAYKPQLGLLLPLALLAARQWRALLGAMLGGAGLFALSLLSYGASIWHAYSATAGATRHWLLEHNDGNYEKMQSVFGWVRAVGGSVSAAYGAQLLLALLVAGCVWRIWRSRVAHEVKAAAVIIGCLLVSPYSFDYDVMLLAPAIGFLVCYGLRAGFAPYEKSLLAALWAVGLPARAVAEATGVFLAPLLMLMLLLLLWQRALRESVA